MSDNIPARAVFTPTNGGLGLSSFEVGDVLFASATDTIATLASVATGSALISGGVGVAPSYGKIGLATHVDGTLPVSNGGSGQSTYTDGQLLIGNTAGNTLAKATLTAGSGITITNGAGSIEIASSSGAGFATTEYNTAQSGTAYSVPASAKGLNIVMCGGGGGGGGAGSGAGYSGGAGGGAAGLTRFLTVPISSADTVLITVGTGGTGGAANPGGSGVNGTAGSSSIVSINGKQIIAPGGGGGGASTGAGNGGGGGGSAGSQAGGNAAQNVAGAAGLSTVQGSWQVSVLGFIGVAGRTTDASGSDGTSAGVITRNDVLVGGSGGGGGKASTSATAGDGGNAQGNCFIGGVAAALISNPTYVSPGAGGGASGLSNGGASSTAAIPTVPSYGAGGAGGSSQDPTVGNTFTFGGANGGVGYVSLTWF